MVIDWIYRNDSGIKRSCEMQNRALSSDSKLRVLSLISRNQEMTYYKMVMKINQFEMSIVMKSNETDMVK